MRRWKILVDSPVEKKQFLFHPTLRNGLPADRHIDSVIDESLPGHPRNRTPLSQERGPCVQPVRYGFRSFNRQWIIPDPRVITQPNADLWRSLGDRQVFLTALTRASPTGGPALTLTCLLPDGDHYKGSFAGRAFSLWGDSAATRLNLRPSLLKHLSALYGTKVAAEDLFAYIAAIAAHPGYVERFRADLATPGLRIPLTADAEAFAYAAALGRRVVWLHTFGDRFADASAGRKPGLPRLPVGRRPQVPKGGAIPSDAAGMPDSMSYDASTQRLRLSSGCIEPVPSAVWHYEVSGKQVLVQWFSYRKKNRERPIIGERRKPSPLGDIQPEGWLAEYTSELLNVLNVLGLLVDLEPAQANLVQRICTGPLIDDATLRKAEVFAVTEARKRKLPRGLRGPDLLTDVPSLGS